MGLIKSIARRGRKFAQARSLPLPGFLTCSGIRVFRNGERRDGRRRQNGGAEMFSVDCSLRRRKFALSFSLWSGALNPFLLQIQSPLLREVLPFIVNPRFFIARVSAILHGQRKMIFENRASPRRVLISGYRRGKLRDAALLILKPGALRSLIRNVPKVEDACVTHRPLMRALVSSLYAWTRREKYWACFISRVNDFSGAGWNKIAAKFPFSRQSWCYLTETSRRPFLFYYEARWKVRARV